MSWDQGNSGDWGAPAPRGPGLSQMLRTSVLMAGLIALLAWMGLALGGRSGMLLFGVIGVLFNFGAWWFSDKIALAVHRAQPADPVRDAWLFDMVRELSVSAGIPMPAVHIIPSHAPNAFATGRSPSHAAVAVTSGIVRILDRRELRGVMAHELAHIRNRDTLISTIAASIAGLISSVATALKWAFIFGGSRSRDDEDGPSGVEMIVMAVVAPLVAMLVQMAISRSREYAADETGARICGDPDALASALEKLQRGAEMIDYEHGGPATAHLFIVNPFSAKKMFELFSTHPDTDERVRRLRNMAMGVR